jgi:pimeloyl-ACP methyl ester carboxylesterase
MKKWYVLFAALFLNTAYSQVVGLFEIPTRSGVKQPFLYSKAAAPVATAILFQGGNGRIGVAGSQTNAWARIGGFLSDGARRFTDNGITVAIFEAPSDKSSLDGGFRNTPEHNQDVAALIAFLRKENPGLPVWLIGTSNGSLSAASAAANLSKAERPDGIVLTSSTTSLAPTGQTHSHPVWAAKLDQIEVPVLFVHHKNDQCSFTPYDAIPKILPNFSKAEKIELITIEGGSTQGHPCHSGYHQFYGIQDDTTRKIADWMKVNKLK